jgi:YD repeat-containing protein
MQSIKKRLVVLLAAAALLPFAGCGSKKAAETLSIADLPDTVSDEIVDLPENKAVYRRTSYQYEDGEVTCKRYDDFDEHDNIIRSETVGDPENMQMTEVYCYTYDENGNVTEKTQSYINPPSTDRKTFFYDRFYYYPDGTMNYHVNYMEDNDSGLWRKNYCREYDSRGSEILYLNYDADGKVLYRSETKCEYGSGGELIKETWQGDGLSQATEFTYDEAGNVLTKVRTESSDNSDDSTVYTTECSYDSKGDLIKETQKVSNGDSSSTEFEYDDKGRLISKDIVELNADKHTAYSYRYEYEDINS